MSSCACRCRTARVRPRWCGRPARGSTSRRRRGALAVVGAYLSHGVEHILFGVDHLLFVLGLILIVRSTRNSLIDRDRVHRRPFDHTLACDLRRSACAEAASRGVYRAEHPVAGERDPPAAKGERSLTSSWPWAVAFLFGLLHGLGFASALIDIGLPQGDVPLALLAFNIGVEVGQLAFIAAVLLRDFASQAISNFRLWGRPAAHCYGLWGWHGGGVLVHRTASRLLGMSTEESKRQELLMSAFGPKQTWSRCAAHVRFRG